MVDLMILKLQKMNSFLEGVVTYWDEWAARGGEKTTADEGHQTKDEKYLEKTEVESEKRSLSEYNEPSDKKDGKDDDEGMSYKKEDEEKPYKKEDEEKPYKNEDEEKPYKKEDDDEEKPYKNDDEEKPYKKEDAGGEAKGSREKEEAISDKEKEEKKHRDDEKEKDAEKNEKEVPPSDRVMGEAEQYFDYYNGKH